MAYPSSAGDSPNNAAAATAIAVAYGLGDRADLRPTRHPAIFRLVTAEAAYAVRVEREPGSTTIPHNPLWMNVHERAVMTGVRSPRLHRHRGADGTERSAHTLPVTINGRPANVTVLDWVNGVQVATARRNLSDEQMISVAEQLGANLAALQKVTARASPLPNAVDTRHRLGAIKSKYGMFSSARRVAVDAHNELEALNKQARPVLSHNDPSLENLIYGADSGELTIVDYEHASGFDNSNLIPTRSAQSDFIGWARAFEDRRFPLDRALSTQLQGAFVRGFADKGGDLLEMRRLVRAQYLADTLKDLEDGATMWGADSPRARASLAALQTPDETLPGRLLTLIDREIEARPHTAAVERTETGRSFRS